MRITGLGHAGMFIETAGGSILCDPVIGPTFFGSWFPFPDNRGLDWERFGKADFLYVSHRHRDHFDPALMHRFVPKDIKVLLPDYPTDDLETDLRKLGYDNIIYTQAGVPLAVRRPHADGDTAARAERRPDRRLLAERRRRDRQHPEPERLASARPREAALLLEARGVLHPGLGCDLVADGLRPAAGRQAELREAQARRPEQAGDVLHREGGCRARLPDGGAADVPPRRALPLQRAGRRGRLDLHRSARVPRAHARPAARAEGVRVPARNGRRAGRTAS